MAELRGVLDAAGQVGVDQRDLCQTHAHLEEQQRGRSRSLHQYLKVFSFVSVSAGVNAAASQPGRRKTLRSPLIVCSFVMPAK